MRRLDIGPYVNKPGRAHKLDLTYISHRECECNKEGVQKLGKDRKRKVRGGGNHAEKDKSVGLVWRFGRWEVCELVGLFVC